MTAAALGCRQSFISLLSRLSRSTCWLFPCRRFFTKDSTLSKKLCYFVIMLTKKFHTMRSQMKNTHNIHDLLLSL